MNRNMDRREFLKLSAVLPPSIYFARSSRNPGRFIQNPAAENVLIVVFDALSAENISLYGYRRETMPNLARIAERATVYHNHHAGGNYTTPGTATLLTGSYPWTHRAVKMGHEVIGERERKNIFSAFDQYYRIAYAHNSFADVFLRQFSASLDLHKPQLDLYLNNELALDRFFENDYDLASVAWERSVKRNESGYSYSLFFSSLYEEYSQGKIKDLSDIFPKGIPHTGSDNYFLLEQGIDWLMSQVSQIPQPFLGYFHFLPPHAPYSPRRDYDGTFRDDGVGYLIEKPKSIFGGRENVNLRLQSRERRSYDEYILYADGELGRLYDFLDASGLLENTWLVFTSDHGEMMERGIYKHITPVMYESLLHIPLLIIEPGQERRKDVYSLTSAVDVLPTLLKVTGQELPDWVEGQVLPLFSDASPDPERSVYAVEAKLSEEGGPLFPVTAAVLKDGYKLVYFSGYEELGNAGSYLELFDLENDPEELNNLYDAKSSRSQELLKELMEKIRAADRPYLKS